MVTKKEKCSFAKWFTDDSDKNIEIIMHTRQSILFNLGSSRVKGTDTQSSFDVVMGESDNEYICHSCRR